MGLFLSIKNEVISNGLLDINRTYILLWNGSVNDLDVWGKRGYNRVYFVFHVRLWLSWKVVGVAREGLQFNPSELQAVHNGKLWVKNPAEHGRAFLRDVNP
jgi:hypothetical protein